MSTSSPLSSPPSSPSPFPDSSPPSSPGSSIDGDFDIISLDSPFQHPFSGSTKQVRQPRLYEKSAKRSISAISDGEVLSPINLLTNKKVRYDSELPPSPEEFVETWNVRDESPTTSRGTPERAFSDLVDWACMNTSVHITFESQNLSYIPEAAIQDLGNIVILGERSEVDFVTSKALLPAESAQTHARKKSLNFARTSSSAVPLSGVPRDAMTLLLADNSLRRLPPRLFHLSRLTVLSLRGNKLLFLPPEIHLLRSLKELNVARNELTYLPAEMLDMKLNTLSIQPNPFLPPPPLPANSTTPRRTLSRSTTSRTRLFDRPKLTSPIKRADENNIPSLFELCFRRFFSFSSLSSVSQFQTTSHSRSTALAGIEFCDPEGIITDHLPPLINTLVNYRLHYSKPGIVKGYPKESVSQVKVPDDMTGIGICPAPHHTYTPGSHSGLFFQHFEERFTWESVIAGVENLGEIPVRWRGCERGCLEFLGNHEEAKSTLHHANLNANTAIVSASEQPGGLGSGSFVLASNAISPNSPAVVNVEEVLQLVKTADSFTEEEFDDHA